MLLTLQASGASYTKSYLLKNGFNYIQKLKYGASCARISLGQY